MTLQQVYKSAKETIDNSELAYKSDYAFDINCLMECFLGKRHEDVIINPKFEVDEKDRYRFNEAIKKRASGYPLQYILGEWEFDGLTLKIGEGVLIPREDTITLVNAVSEFIDINKSVRILDLCAGSGTISLSLAKRFPLSEIVAIELSDTAIEYLEINKKLNQLDNVEIIKADITGGIPHQIKDGFDALVSNPPYIKSGDIKKLQKEVQYEPEMALDGGKNGLYFYELICDKWLHLLKSKGTIAFEIGEDQGEEVSNILKQHTNAEPTILKDINSLDRAILATKL